ncbi:RNase adaptor protein RapZ [Anoxybacter fermentans]|uniref:RNase adaptor protein RapZ n=1 Tax=Anoxybacter fermentans TaxID=1323375 RepID=A0A3Q9HP14_9FIRM|nr:RNase adapter RapZ [Anoxybacter fermentans]AZR72273.1 RNase adaptor protein RapZ [Anoxybacter fermentans]
MNSRPKFVIVTGMSGAGKTQAIRIFEDFGYFCIDNLPSALISKFVELCIYNQQINNVALVMDIRGGEFFEDLIEELANLDDLGVNYEILFLEATTDVLVRRYKETRRRHPLAAQCGGRIIDAIEKERTMLEELRGMANKIIDTSDISTKDLREEILANFGVNAINEFITITAMSFGFKYGIPLDADLVIDVRFLPNPYYVPSLKKLTGLQTEVQEYVLKWPIAEKFMDKFLDLIKFLIPHYIKEGKTHLTIAIGCTGGKHRSVTLTEKLAEFLESLDYKVIVDHRDIEKK